jgi:hypothetical protein
MGDVAGPSSSSFSSPPSTLETQPLLAASEDASGPSSTYLGSGSDSDEISLTDDAMGKSFRLTNVYLIAGLCTIGGLLQGFDVSSMSAIIATDQVSFISSRVVDNCCRAHRLRLIAVARLREWIYWHQISV